MAIMIDPNPKCNAEGYQDLTAHDAIQNCMTDDERFHELLHTIFYMASCAGFEVDNRIVLKDLKTGKVWR